MISWQIYHHVTLMIHMFFDHFNNFNIVLCFFVLYVFVLCTYELSIFWLPLRYSVMSIQEVKETFRSCVIATMSIFDKIFEISTKLYGCNWPFERLSDLTLRHESKVRWQHFYCSYTFHSHCSVFNNEHNSYPKMSVKRSLTCSWVVLVSYTHTIQQECTVITVMTQKIQKKPYKVSPALPKTNISRNKDKNAPYMRLFISNINALRLYG